MSDNDFPILPQFFVHNWLVREGILTSDRGDMLPPRTHAYKTLSQLGEDLGGLFEKSWISVDAIRKHADRYVSDAVGERLPRGERAIVAVIELYRLDWKPLRRNEFGTAMPCWTGRDLAQAAEEKLRELYQRYGRSVLTKLLE